MLEKLQVHITKNFSFLKEKKLLIAISGGLDSVVLTHLLHQLKYTISLAHCNFKLRDTESDKDEVFIKKIGNQLNIETFSKSFNTNKYAKDNKLSIQIAARNLRYKWFNELINKNNFDYLLTAHHADDNLETFLINLSRGTGLEGLTGIPSINNHIIRPLLIFSRDELQLFAIQNNIAWREDTSNASTKYIRNKIRHQITPILKEINPSLLDSFKKTIENIQENQQIVTDTIVKLKKELINIDDKGVKRINILGIQQLSNPKAYLFELLKEYGFTEWNDVVNLLNAQSGKEVTSKTHRLIKDRDFLLLTEKSSQNQSVEILITKDTKEILEPFHLKFDTVSKVDQFSKNIIYVDKEKLTFPLQLRKWQESDYFYPKGMQGKKKIAKYFKDEKFSTIEKENTWLLCSNDKIIWVVGHRKDKRFTPDKDTKLAVKIEKFQSVII